MNRQNILALNLQVKFFILLLIAVLAPVIIFAGLSFTSASRLSLENMQSYIAESGARRQQAIENDFRNAFNVLNTFLDNYESQLTAPLVIRELFGTSAESLELENQVEDLMTTRLISQGLFNSMWLMTRRGQIFSSVTSPSASLSDTRNLQSADHTERILQGGRQMIEQGDAPQALLVVQLDNGGQHVLLINPLFAQVEGDNLRHVGYMLMDLNLQTIVEENLAIEEGLLDTYAYVIVPDSTTYLTTPDARRRNLIDTASVGAQLSLDADAGSGVATYFVGDNQGQREVIGYYAPIVIGDKRFALVAEIDTAIVQGQLFTAYGSISFPMLMGSILFIMLMLLFANQMITPPINRLREAIQGLMRGNFSVPIIGLERGDEIGTLAQSFVDMREQVRTLTADMDRRLQERIRDVRVTQNISRTVTAERDLNRLMTQVVNLIVENFPSIYHAQIFLLDNAREYGVLRASTGDAGRALLQRGHKLGVGSISVIGQVTEQGQVIIARDTTESDVHRRNEFLQDTRAELAIPLRLGSNIIGALDVQSQERDSFDPDQVTALQTLADQITIAIENARLYEESARLLADLERDRRATTRYVWQQYMNAEREHEITTTAGTETDYNFSDLKQAVYTSGHSIVGERTNRNTIPFAVPINLRRETLGVIEYEIPESEFTYDKVLLAEELVSRLAISLDNARLFQASQQSVERERIVNEISAQLTGQTDIETIFQTAIQEVGRALRTQQVAIRLQSNNGQQHNGHSNGQPSQPDADTKPDRPA